MILKALTLSDSPWKKRVNGIVTPGFRMAEARICAWVYTLLTCRPKCFYTHCYYSADPVLKPVTSLTGRAFLSRDPETSCLSSSNVVKSGQRLAGQREAIRVEVRGEALSPLKQVFRHEGSALNALTILHIEQRLARGTDRQTIAAII